MRSLLYLALLTISANLFAAPVAVDPCVAMGTSPARPTITGIAFVAFYTSDEKAAERFYTTELGLRSFAGTAGKTVYPVNKGQWIETVPSATTPRNSHQAAVGLTTSDALAMRCYLQSKGYSALALNKISGVLQPTFLSDKLAVHDPEGNTIVFVQAKSGTSIHDSTPSPHAISRRIIHAGFVVQSQDAENAFYRDILGFKPYWHGGFKEGTDDWVSQQVPDGTDWIEYMLNVKLDATAAQRGGANHVSLGVETMDTVIAQLKTNGCATAECSASKLGRDGKVQLNLFDPDHTRVEVMEFKPTGTTCCSPYTGPMPTANDPE